MSSYNNQNKKHAVALKYDVEKNKAPMVIAGGSGYVA
ncbi:MAG: hypothetical protein K0Q97_2295, partial [Bacillota bacterium]|nr:hypothetical protein [Bacillota bacterium]